MEGSMQSYIWGEDSKPDGDSASHKGSTLAAIKGQTSKENRNTRTTCKKVDKIGAGGNLTQLWHVVVQPNKKWRYWRGGTKRGRSASGRAGSKDLEWKCWKPRSSSGSRRSQVGNRQGITEYWSRNGLLERGRTNSREDDLWRLDVLCENIQVMARHLWSVRWKAISRSANKSAYWIAKKAKLRVCFDNWVIQPLPSLGTF